MLYDNILQNIAKLVHTFFFKGQTHFLNPNNIPSLSSSSTIQNDTKCDIAKELEEFLTETHCCGGG
jgi:hypothetical protein